MADPDIISALRAKRAEIEGNLRDIERQAEQLRADAATIDGALRIFDPSGAPQTSRQPRKRAPNGSFSRAVLDVIRRAKEPLTCRQIGERIVAERGLPGQTPHERELFTNRVRQVLGREREGLVSEKRGDTVFWQANSRRNKD